MDPKHYAALLKDAEELEGTSKDPTDLWSSEKLPPDLEQVQALICSGQFAAGENGIFELNSPVL